MKNFAQITLALIAFAMSTAAQSAPDGSTPPTLLYNPSVGSTINFSGVTTPGTNGNATIGVTASGGTSGGATGLSCTFVGANAVNFTVTPSSLNLATGAPPASLNLGCQSGTSQRTATLNCAETPNGITGPTRSWPVICPAGVSNTPPTLSYNPAPGSAVVFSAANNLVGQQATAQIRITPSGGSGTGISATTRVSNCTLSGETVANTFAGFQGVNLQFVGSTTTPQNINLTAQIRSTNVAATLTCQEIVGNPNGTEGTPGTRSWPLQVAAGQTPARMFVRKTSSASTVAANAEFAYTIAVENDGSSALTGLVLLDNVPAGLTVLGAAGAGWSCSVAGNAVDCRRSTLAANAETEVTIDVRAPNASASLLNTVTVSSNEIRNPVAANVSVTVNAAPAGFVDLQLSTIDTPDPVVVNGSLNMAYTITNRGTAPASGVALDAELATFTFVSASGAGWSCNSAVSSSCALATPLSAGASSTVTLQLRAPSAAATVSTRATVRSTEPDANPADNVDAESTVVTTTPPPPPDPRADLEVTAQVVPATAITGQAVEFQFAANNRGPDPASNVVLQATFAATLEVRSAAGEGFSCQVTGQLVRCTRATQGLNASSTVRVGALVRPGSTAVADAVAQISSATQDPVPNNNSARAVLAYQSGGADLSIVKTDSADPVRAGAEFSYTLAVNNAGPEAASGVRIIDTLPANLIFVSASGAGAVCGRTGQVVTCTLAANLAAGAATSVTIVVRAPTTGQSVTNEGTVSATTSDSNLANNRATQSTTINNRNADDLATLLNPLATDPASRAAVPVVAGECARSLTGLGGACADIIRAADEGRGNEVGDALRAIAPDEVLAQSVVLREIGATQFFNVDARLSELRRGGGGFSLSGLTVTQGAQTIPVAIASDAIRAALGFGDDGLGGLLSQWGFFINGNITSGEQDLNRTRGNVGVDYDSRGITAGVDYRFNTRAVAGVALGLASFDADVSGGSTLETQSVMLTGYGSYYINDRLYVDSRMTIGNASLDQARTVRFQVGSRLVDAVAVGETDATQFTIASSMGYHLNYGPWSVTPNLGFRYTSSDVDEFSEDGAGAFNVRYDDASFDSVNVALGVQVARAVSMRTGVLMPQFDLSLNNESGDDPSSTARLVGATGSEFFRLQEEGADSSYATAGLGFVYLIGNGRQAFFSYRRTFGYDDFDRGTLNLGGRFEF